MKKKQKQTIKLLVLNSWQILLICSIKRVYIYIQIKVIGQSS